MSFIYGNVHVEPMRFKSVRDLSASDPVVFGDRPTTGVAGGFSAGSFVRSTDSDVQKSAKKSKKSIEEFLYAVSL